MSHATKLPNSFSLSQFTTYVQGQGPLLQGHNRFIKCRKADPDQPCTSSPHLCRAMARSCRDMPMVITRSRFARYSLAAAMKVVSWCSAPPSTQHSRSPCMHSMAAFMIPGQRCSQMEGCQWGCATQHSKLPCRAWLLLRSQANTPVY